jgi:tetratricopeptide (TPR) repeat protein
VGIAWAGSPNHKNDHNRSLSLAALGTLARVPGVVFYSIQKGPAASQASAPPPGMQLIDLTAELRDFADTAALVANLDLVICVDTAPAHLAGALGKPVWVLLPYAPDWRWLLEREDSPWYPTMRLFRQKSWGDWDPVLERVTQALGRQAGAAPAPAAPVQPQELLKEAVHHHQSGDYRAAESLYRRVLAAAPDNADALHLLGVALRQLKQHEDAEQYIRRAIAARPETAQYHASFGNLHKDRARYEEAAASYREALRLKPDYAEVHYNLGTTLHHLNRMDEALAHFREATRHNPSFAEAWYNLGNVLQDREAFGEARACYERAIELKPGDVRAHSNLGTVHIQEGRLPAAIAAFEGAIAVDGDSADAHWNLSLALLLTGDFRRGWHEYEWRWKTVDGRKLERRFPRPRFTGQDPQGCRILLHAEQGFGDAIQFVRYAAPLAARGATIIIESRPETARLFGRAAGVSQVVTSGSALPEFDLHSPLLSLPGALGTTLETVPRSVPYLSAEPGLMDHWRQRVRAGPPGLRVGLAWAGRPEHPHDRFRSIALDSLAPLLAVPDVAWYSLQKSAPGARFPATARAVDPTMELQDFADTAALVSALDLVICVDTSVAHLAGALGKPVWVLLACAPDWRWLLSREDSPWYPTMRLFRQDPSRDWRRVIERVAAALTTATSRRAAS